MGSGVWGLGTGVPLPPAAVCNSGFLRALMPPDSRPSECVGWEVGRGQGWLGLALGLHRGRGLLLE